MKLEASYDLAPRFQSSGLSAASLLLSPVEPFVYRFADLKPALYPPESSSTDLFILGQNLDRASLSLHTAPVDITVGRQAIAWGSARSVNPTDILAPFTFGTLDTEDRIGVDAVRARIPLGTLSEIDTGYVFGKDFLFQNSAAYGRIKAHACRTDMAFLLMGFRRNLMFGFDLARAIRGAGFWIESAYVLARATESNAADDRRAYLRVSSGADYSFTDKTYGFLEYHFNGAGKALPGEYPDALAEPAYLEGSVYLLGRHYLISGMHYRISGLLTVMAQSMMNLTDRSLLLAPQMEYNLVRNIYLGAGAFFGFGGNRERAESGGPVPLRTEFGGYPNICFGSIRYYF